jgi:ferrous iron transport protein A
MPLTLVRSNAEFTVKKVGGKDEVRKRLEKLGFVTGSLVSVVSELGGILIVKVKDSRVAISREMAQKVMV